MLKLTITLFVTSFFVASCGTSPVKLENKTSDKSFDGRWIGTISGTVKQQSVDINQLLCGDFEYSMPLDVDNGTATADFSRRGTVTGYIDDEGFFKLQLPLDDNPYRPTANSDANKPAYGEEAFYVVNGKLDSKNNNGSGKFTLAARSMNMGGCVTNISFQRE